MKITKYGHACLLVEENGVRFLLDPGSYSSGFEGLTELDAILITHEHADHLVIDKVKELLEHNPGAMVITDEASAAQLAEAGVKTTTVHEGDKHDVKGVEVVAVGSKHAIIHPTIPQAVNVGYLIAGSFFYPGDALTVPPGKVKILALPSVAPWSKISETIDYLLEVKPQIAIPVHDGFLTTPGLFGQMLGNFSQPAGIEL